MAGHTDAAAQFTFHTFGAEKADYICDTRKLLTSEAGLAGSAMECCSCVAPGKPCLCALLLVASFAANGSPCCLHERQTNRVQAQ